jgi:hypothetical protein
MPAMISDSVANPLSSKTLASSSFAPGATAATVDPTCVPCPIRSTVSGDSPKLRSACSRPARSGWVWSTPESTTPTVTPSPVYPAAHAAGAPIRGTLSSSSALRLPSSHTFPLAVRADQCEPSLATATGRSVISGRVGRRSS